MVSTHIVAPIQPRSASTRPPALPQSAQGASATPTLSAPSASARLTGTARRSPPTTSPPEISRRGQHPPPRHKGAAPTHPPTRMASAKVAAPVGMIMNSWKASWLPACTPPLMMLKEGTGSTTLELPARSAMWRYRGTPFSAAPACAAGGGGSRQAGSAAGRESVSKQVRSSSASWALARRSRTLAGHSYVAAALQPQSTQRRPQPQPQPPFTQPQPQPQPQRLTRATARETARMPLAPSLDLLSVPSSSIILRSTSSFGTWKADEQQMISRLRAWRVWRQGGSVAVKGRIIASESMASKHALPTGPGCKLPLSSRQLSVCQLATAAASCVEQAPTHPPPAPPHPPTHPPTAPPHPPTHPQHPLTHPPTRSTPSPTHPP